MTKPSWDDIRIFLTYLRSKSVATAADALKISPPTVSRRINALQKALGFPLLHRSAHGFELTQSAQTLVEIWLDAERLLVNAPTLVDRLHSTQPMELRFSTTPALAMALIFPNLHRFITRWPNVTLDINTSVRVIDLGAGQGDVALRYVEPERGAVIRQHVGSVSFNVYCAEALLPPGFQTAGDWPMIAALGLRAISWSSESSVSPQQTLHNLLGGQPAGMIIHDFSGLIEGICQGLGMGILPDMVGRRLHGVQAIAAPQLVDGMPLWLVVADRLANYPHVLAFRDFLREAVRQELRQTSSSVPLKKDPPGSAIRPPRLRRRLQKAGPAVAG